MVKKFLMDKLNGGFAASTVTHMKNAIGGVLNLAVDDEVLAANPAHELGRVIRHKGLRIEIDPLNHEELAHFLATFRSSFPMALPDGIDPCAYRDEIGRSLGVAVG